MLRRVQLMLDDDLDRRLENRARIRGISKSELVRRILRQEFPPLPPLHEDPLWKWATEELLDIEPAHHDDVVYGLLDDE